MKNKKGFTLIELIAVLGIISIIILVGAPSLINQVESSKQNKYDNFVADLCLAAETYINHSKIQEANQLVNAEDKIRINVSDLIVNGYVKSSLKNPKTKEKINNEDYLRIKLTESLTYSCKLNDVGEWVNDK